MSVSTTALPPGVGTSREVPTLPLAYVSPMPAVRPPLRPLAPLAALGAGTAVLLIALYALLALASMLTAPQAAAYDRGVWNIFPPLLGWFAGVCTVVALIFFGVGLKWLGGVRTPS
jgi:hypothetical protein